MADKQVSVTLTGKDNLSPVFQKVGASATTAGKQIDTASKTAEQSMSRFEQAALKAETATGRLGISATKVGATMGTAVSAGLLLSVRAAADAEVSQQRLQTTIEATGALFEQYGSQIDAVNNKALSLSFDDEDAQDALSGLIQATGDVNQSLDQMGLAMDIARGRGIDLASATKIVIAADQERFTALKRLGIQIDENSTKESVLADLQQKYAGQAQAYADTNAGAFDRWKNAVENASESVGAFLGPAQQLLLIFPGITAGFAGMGAGISKLGGASGALSAFTGLLAGPVGIVGGALAAAAAIGALANYLSDDYTAATETATAASQAFTDNLIAMGQAGTLSRINQQVAQQGIIIDDYAKSLAATADEQNDFIERIHKFQTSLSGAGSVINAHTQSVKDMFSQEEIKLIDGIIDGNEDGALSFEELTKAAESTDIAIANTGEGAAAYATAWASAQNDINEIMTQTDQAGIDAQARLLETMKHVRNGEQTMAGAAKTIAEIRQEMEETQAQAAATGDAMAAQSGQVDTLAGSYRNLNEYLESYRQNQQGMGGPQGLAGEHRDTAAAIAVEAASLDAAAAAGRKWADVEAKMAGASFAAANMAGPKKPQRKLSDAQAELADSYETVTTAVTGTTQALESGFRVAVSNTDAIASQAQSVADWAAAFTDSSEGISKLDSILTQNATLTTAATLNQEDYTAATEAFNDIARENAEIQQDIAVIQAKQAPIMADLMEQQENYLQSLAESSPEQQRFALAMMDSSTAAEALQLATSLLGENGDVFAPMVEAAANLDPYLAAILVQMGLIEQQKDGTWTVTLDDQASSPMADLSASINDLADQVYILTTYLDDDETNDGIGRLEAQLADLSQFVATPTVNLQDYASGSLGTILGYLQSLDGYTVTTYVNTVSSFSGSAISPLGYGGSMNGGTTAYANGGTSPYGYSRAAANGLTATLVGERGPEVLMLPGGAQVMNTEGSRSRRGGGGGGLQIHIHGNVYGLADLEDKITDSISRAWVRANQMHERSMGR